MTETTGWRSAGDAAVAVDVPLVGHLVVWRDDENEWRFNIGTDQWLTTEKTMKGAMAQVLQEVRRQVELLERRLLELAP